MISNGFINDHNLNNVSCIQYLFESITDCSLNLMIRKDELDFETSSKLSKDTVMILNKFIISKLCGIIETRLRLEVHDSLQLLQTEHSDPFQVVSSKQTNTITIGSVYRLLALKVCQYLRATDTKTKTNVYLSIRDHVGKYLSQMFYNLTTISMSDWRTYGQLRVLAQHKFALETVEDHLPTQTLEQGLDVLEIMRNIHFFVTIYTYNLNNQIFIEKNSRNKHLNSINIRHIANSLRTHGTGIINTTVI